MEPGWAAPTQLRERGVEPMDIRTVVMTHLHYDHAGAVTEFPQATFVVDRREWRAAPAPAASRRATAHKLIDHPYDWREVDFDDPRVASFVSFGRTVDLFGDGSIRLVSTPGHSRATCRCCCAPQSGRELLLTGDAAYSRADIEEDLVPTFCDDVHDYSGPWARSGGYASTRRREVTICGHDPERWPGSAPLYRSAPDAETLGAAVGL